MTGFCFIFSRTPTTWSVLCLEHHGSDVCNVTSCDGRIGGIFNSGVQHNLWCHSMHGVCLSTVRKKNMGSMKKSLGLFQWLSLANGGRRRETAGAFRARATPQTFRQASNELRSWRGWSQLIISCCRLAQVSAAATNIRTVVCSQNYL